MNDELIEEDSIDKSKVYGREQGITVCMLEGAKAKHSKEMNSVVGGDMWSSYTNGNGDGSDDDEHCRRNSIDTESTPLVTSESSARTAIDNEFDNDPSYSLMREGMLGCRKHSFRYHAPIVAILLLLAATGISNDLSFASLWILSTASSSTTTSSSTSSDSENAAKIAQLRESLGSSLQELKQAAVASDNKICSKVGASILQKGGNAMDAGVATSLCLGVASPASSGLGGGAFVLVRSNKSQFTARRFEDVQIPEFVDARTSHHNTIDEDSDFVTEVIDCREVAPAKASTNMYEGLPNSASMTGGLAIAVPGELRGLELAHARHGRLPWKDLVEPAMVLARDGVPVDEHLDGFIRGFVRYSIQKFGGALTQPFLQGIINYLTNGETGEYLRRGDLLQNQPLAKTLQAIATDGANALYKGNIAENLVKDVQAANGILTLHDMHSYKPVLRTPISANIHGYTIYGVPPPSSGGAVIIGILRFLSGYSSMFSEDARGLSYHRMVEGLRHAFAIRMSLSDPAFHTNVTADAVRDLTTSDYMEKLRKMSRDDTVLPLSQYGGPKWAQLKDKDGASEAEDAHEGDRRRLSSNSNLRKKTETNAQTQNGDANPHHHHRHRRLARPFGYLEDNGTSHISVVDGDGNAVAITTSINNIFGSKVYSETTGVLLGNTMDDFGVPSEPDAYGICPSEANFIVPGKRPLSSMSPTIVLKTPATTTSTNSKDERPPNPWGDLVLVWGGSGGPKIISSVLNVFLNVLVRKMSLFDAVTAPRIHDQLVYHGSIVTTTEKVVLEHGQGPLLEVPRGIKFNLKERHHRLLDIDYTGCVQAILVDHETNTLSAVSDMRKDGSPSGY